MQYVSSQLQSHKCIVKAKMGSVASKTYIIDPTLSRLTLHIKYFSVITLRFACAMRFCVDSRIQIKINRICIASQVDSTIDSRPNGIAKGFTTAVIQAKQGGCRNGKAVRLCTRADGIGIIDERTAICLMEVFYEIVITAGVCKKLPALPYGLRMVFHEHGGIIELP